MGTASCRVPELSSPGGLAGAGQCGQGGRSRETQACFRVLPVPLHGLVCSQAGLPPPDLLSHVLLPSRPQLCFVVAKAAAAPLLEKPLIDLAALAVSTASVYWPMALCHGGGVSKPTSEESSGSVQAQLSQRR